VDRWVSGRWGSARRGQCSGWPWWVWGGMVRGGVRVGLAAAASTGPPPSLPPARRPTPPLRARTRRPTGVGITVSR
jgi:hypothetical protein